ncbi:hypothetical protein [Edaphobacter aggregans]|uniref:hypothetical protein n=1 Tax=Edaphobacter aggregans TaxID=570835 RepID=UPI0005511762|nr:hypothetical protein [Edaphobacter aggregans]
MNLPAFKAGWPQRLAALLLVLFLGQCLWVISHQQLSTDDYRYARCGREMWEKPSPLAGYFTSCGNLHGDGTFAYRVAGLPLTAQRVVLLAADKLRSPENRLYASTSINGSTWEARHELTNVKYLLHLPFVFFALWLGAGLWWVARRLFGNEGGFFALGLYCFSPAIVRYAVVPNNDVLAMWGLYGLVYTAIGVAHAMQGPRRKWRPRIVLLMLALGLTAAAHLLAAILGFLAAVILMMYLAERRRSYVMQILIFSALGAIFVVFASYAFRLSAFRYVFTGGSARFWFSLHEARAFVTDPANAPTLVAFAVAAVLYLGVRRCRYFGNTTPLVMTLAIMPIVTTQAVTQPWLWALPFLFTFLGGVFADVLESRYRKLFLALSGLILVTQAILCVTVLPAIAHQL